MINGVKITPLKQIFDERGKVMHMLRGFPHSPDLVRYISHALIPA